MTNINLHFPLRDLSGADILNPDGSALLAGKLLAGMIAQETKGDALKLFGWALKLNQGEPLSLDKSDVRTLRDIIADSPNLTILAKAQLLEAIDAA